MPPRISYPTWTLMRQFPGPPGCQHLHESPEIDALLRIAADNNLDLMFSAHGILYRLDDEVATAHCDVQWLQNPYRDLTRHPRTIAD